MAFWHSHTLKLTIKKEVTLWDRLACLRLATQPLSRISKSNSGYSLIHCKPVVWLIQSRGEPKRE